MHPVVLVTDTHLHRCCASLARLANALGLTILAALKTLRADMSPGSPGIWTAAPAATLSPTPWGVTSPTAGAMFNHAATATSFADASKLLDDTLLLMFGFYSHDSDDVSEAVLDFVREYLHFLKSIAPATPLQGSDPRQLSSAQRDVLRSLLQITAHKMKFKSSEYNFNNPGDAEEVLRVHPL